MDLYLVRHAIAFDPDPARWPDDSRRPLTGRGRRRFRLAARGARRVLPRPAVVLSSPATRALATAQLLTREAHWPAPVTSDTLAGGDLDAVLATIAAHRNAAGVAIVGHEPHLGALVAHLLGVAFAEDATTIRFRKGAIAHLRLEFVARTESADGVHVLAQPATLGSVELALISEPGPPVTPPVTTWEATLLALLPPATLRALA